MDEIGSKVIKDRRQGERKGPTMRHLVVMASLSVLFWGADGQADICGRTCQSDVECPDSRGVCTCRDRPTVNVTATRIPKPLHMVLRWRLRIPPTIP